jgi:arylsulfatase
MRWPGVIKPDQVINDICSLQDFIPTFAAAAGEPDLVAKVKKGYKIGDTTFKVHLDGYNLLPFLSGKEKCPREGFLYWSDDGDLMALRVQQYKIVFAEQTGTGLEVWRKPLTQMRIPKLFDLRADPFERGEESFKYNDWFLEHLFAQYASQAIVHEWLESFKEFPPRQKSASFSVDQIVEALMPKS